MNYKSTSKANPEPTVPYTAVDPFTRKRYDMQCSVAFEPCRCGECRNVGVSVESLEEFKTAHGEGTFEPVKGSLSEEGWRELFCIMSNHFNWMKKSS